MAHSYYSPRPVRRHSFSDMSPSPIDDELSGDLEQSIFIFPSPRIGSEPPSPLSIPTDVSFPTTTSTAERRGRRTSSVSGISEWATFSGRSVSADTSLRSPIVEVWEMSDEAEHEHEDSSRGEDTTAHTPSNAPSRLQLYQQRYPLGRQPFPNTFTYSDGRFQLRRGRKESCVSTKTGQDSLASLVVSLSAHDAPAAPARPTPYRLPLLAFFSSLLVIDDTTLHLLTRPSHPHTSPLFPGSRLHSIDDNDTILDEKHVLFESPSAALKAGIEVATDPSITRESIFALPLPALKFTYIWDLVAGVCRASVPRKMRLPARAS
ncbi:uncharacterized protein FOMMEDRAFT_143259 [Fomitiporia mediterranea MF3/22]|uniref:uncharacterized protein n=1 Tax=Fomitiporia mediterranea (strain MF3/22) TaxID=694068 RepID=UPI0004408850|nr:uncharacterized protein FOMMEDRAFT_143259 [Fomitiporia mediterranea MF3/22]EJC98488.1 hypothetical protein FOMMEDRAFT_143259 [Fomitiporia mediterranea MF3/22]